ncbi:MAG: hypothetical protein VKP57_09445 [Candidatus Sericytochromatia bacterium]|nr:hypothetical protein [Candidatus Sericytochromatia bacterium]
MPRTVRIGFGVLACLAITAAPSRAERLEFPLALGAGPSWVTLGPSTPQGGPPAGPFTAIRIEAAAVLDRTLLERNMSRVPAGYGRLLGNTDELRVGNLFVPRTLILSRTADTSLVGATWDLVGLRQPLINKGPVRLDLNGRLVLAAARLEQTGLAGLTGPRITNFIRPGIALGVGAALALAPGLNLRVGFDETAFIPQALGGGLHETDGPGGSLWRMGSPWAMVEYQVPFRSTLP